MEKIFAFGNERLVVEVVPIGDGCALPKMKGQMMANFTYFSTVFPSLRKELSTSTYEDIRKSLVAYSYERRLQLKESLDRVAGPQATHDTIKKVFFFFFVFNRHLL